MIEISTKPIHVMIDLETLSSEPDAAVISIGAVVFDAGGVTTDFFCQQINPKDAERFGAVSRETMEWWNKEENKQARLMSFSGTQFAHRVWGDFYRWLANLDDLELVRIHPWGNGADFDLPIVKHHFLEFEGKYPISHKNHRCFRTLKNLVRPTVYENIENTMKHDALADAVYQARVAHRCLQAIGYW